MITKEIHYCYHCGPHFFFWVNPTLGLRIFSCDTRAAISTKWSFIIQSAVFLWMKTRKRRLNSTALLISHPSRPLNNICNHWVHPVEMRGNQTTVYFQFHKWSFAISLNSYIFFFITRLIMIYKEKTSHTCNWIMQFFSWQCFRTSW